MPSPDAPATSSGETARDQPWKKFVQVPEKKTEVIFSDDKQNIRIIEGRVDGKGLGG